MAQHVLFLGMTYIHIIVPMLGGSYVCICNSRSKLSDKLISSTVSCIYTKDSLTQAYIKCSSTFFQKCSWLIKQLEHKLRSVYKTSHTNFLLKSVILLLFLPHYDREMHPVTNHGKHKLFSK